MSTVTAIQQHQPGSLASLDAETMQHLVSGGDCSKLTPAQKTAYYVARCEAAGLDPRAQPFAFMRLNGKEVLYAQKAASDQLAAKHGVRMTIVSQSTEDGIRVVTVRAETKDGRQTDEIGAVLVKGLVGDALCNAMMKAVTKAKRRAVLSICGLGMLDETEVETIPQATPVASAPSVEVLPPEDKREAPRQDSPRTTQAQRNVEKAAEMLGGKTETPPKPKAPPAYVLALFTKLVKSEGTKELATAAFKHAAEQVFGATPKPSNEWTADECKQVEQVVYPSDVPF